MMKPRLVWILGFLGSLTACGAPGKSATYLAAQAAQNVGCKTSQSDMWESLHKIAEDGADFPSPEALRQSLMQQGAARGLNGARFSQYVDDFISNYTTTLNGVRATFDPKTTADWHRALAEMEAGIRVTPAHAALNDQIKTSLSNLDLSEVALDAACAQPQPSTQPQPTPTPPGTVWDELKATQTPEVYGARRVIAVAYQSCDVLSLAPMTSKTPDIQGIKNAVGARPDGGNIRSISSLPALLSSDYYYATPKAAKSSCFKVANDPLIYNFGGKPYVTSSSPYNLDMFTHTNGGGPTLGIDCSGFVFSSLAMAGLKISSDPKVLLKASLVNAYGSSAFKEPQNNGMTCLQKISVDAQTSILPGDIGAIDGHVIMIDAIGADPLGLARAKSLSDCTASVLKSSGFDFTIAQSAAVKNGIGINRIRGVDFMPASATISNGFVAYAVAACRAKFGASPNLSSPSFSIVRHLKTPDCMAPAPLTFSHDDCVASCAAMD